MRSKILSTGRLKTYKSIILMIWIGFLSVIIFVIFMKIEDPSFLEYYWLVYWGGLFVVIYVKRTLKLQNIEYDEKHIYVVKKDHEILVPFLDIKEIKLQSLTGVHTIFLYRDAGFGKEIWFKSSLWYPFNFKKVDDEVYKLQLMIEKVKAQNHGDSEVSLPSQTS
ncbi:MAG: hypothetical protein AAF519_14900 [Bacteroidota bacterium]